MSTKTINVVSTYPATVLVYPGDGPTLLYNTDPINPIWVGDNNAIESGDSLNTIQVPAGTTFGVDGREALYGIANSGSSVLIDLLARGTQFNTGITTRMEAPQLLSNSLPLAPGTTVGPISVTYPSGAQGYLIEVHPVNAGTKTFACDIQISHLDFFGFTVAVEKYTVTNINNNLLSSVIKGRLQGQALGITVTVANSTFLNTITGGSITADSVGLSFYSVTAYSPGLSKRSSIVSASSGLLLGSFTTVALPGTNGTVVFVAALPDYSGPVVISSNTPIGGGFTFVPRIDSYTVTNGPANPVSRLELPSITSANGIIQPASLPSCFNVALIKQLSTVANSAGFSVVVDSTEF